MKLEEGLLSKGVSKMSKSYKKLNKKWVAKQEELQDSLRRFKGEFIIAGIGFLIIVLFVIAEFFY
mgnify:FL=1